MSVGFYFEKKRAIATGLAVCGSGIGTFIFAPLCNLLVEEYTWKGATLILAGKICEPDRGICTRGRALSSFLPVSATWKGATLMRSFLLVSFMNQTEGGFATGFVFN